MGTCNPVNPVTSHPKYQAVNLLSAIGVHRTRTAVFAAFEREILQERRTPGFNAAIRCYGGAHLLPENDVRIMLLWAGIEGLLSVDAELSRRVALYAAIMLDGSPDEKALYFDEVKKSYAIRSRAVHGSGLKRPQMEEGYRAAGRILIGLVARCVEIGRVPSPAELDRLAVSTGVAVKP
jgi:hypothetical protein